MSEKESEFNILEVSSDREDEELIVRSTQDTITEPSKIEAYVDANGIVRQQGNGACFNADVYEVME